MGEINILNLLNNGKPEELIILPGIGPALADRLIAARPFDSLEAVQSVKGISANLLNRLSDVTLEPDSQTSIHDNNKPTTEPLPAEETQFGSSLTDIKERFEEKSRAINQSLSGLGESISKRGQAVRQSVEMLPQKFEEATKTRGSLWTTLLTSAITALIAILLTLAVLGGINGSLKFATGAQYRTIQREVSQLSAKEDTLQQDLDSLRGRVDILEGLGDRTMALEKAQQQLAADLKSASQQVTVIQADVAALNEKVTLQEERTQRFETFLKDLQTMLGNLFAPQGDN
jgi:chromosome segregation ATPase